MEAEDEFMLVGLVLGLAIYNAVLLDFPLPLVLYRKLLGQASSLRDLEDMDPTLGKSLRALLTYDGEWGPEMLYTPSHWLTCLCICGMSANESVAWGSPMNVGVFGGKCCKHT